MAQSTALNSGRNVVLYVDTALLYNRCSSLYSLFCDTLILANNARLNLVRTPKRRECVYKLFSCIKKKPDMLLNEGLCDCKLQDGVCVVSGRHVKE